MQLLYSASVLEQNQLIANGCTWGGAGNGNGNVCLRFDVSMNQKLLQELSPANLKDLLLDATGFMDSDLRS